MLLINGGGRIFVADTNLTVRSNRFVDVDFGEYRSFVYFIVPFVFFG
jgi:hypothetical protein